MSYFDLATLAADKLDQLADALERDSDQKAIVDACDEAHEALKALAMALPARSEHEHLAMTQAAIFGVSTAHTAEKIRRWSKTWRGLGAAR